MRIHLVLVLVAVMWFGVAVPAPAQTEDLTRDYELLREHSDPNVRRRAVSWKRVVAAREWSDITGEYSIEARYVDQDVNSGRVTLKRNDDREITIDVKTLSLKDRRFLKTISRLRESILADLKQAREQKTGSGSAAPAEGNPARPEANRVPLSHFIEDPRIPTSITRVLFWPDVEHVIGTDGRNTIKLSLATSQPVWKCENAVHMAIDPRGNYLVALSEWEPKLIDFETGETIRDIQPAEKITNHPGDLAISPDGQTLAIAAGTDHRVLLNELPSGRPCGVIRTRQPARSVAFSPDGRLLAVSGDGLPGFSLYDADGKRKLKQITWDGMIGGIASHLVFSPDSRLVAGWLQSRSQVWLWDVTTGQPVWTAKRCHVGIFGTIAFSPDGKWLAANGPWPPDSGNLHPALGIYETRSGEEVATLMPFQHGKGLDLRFAFSPDGRRLAAAFKNVEPAGLSIWQWRPMADGPSKRETPISEATPAPGSPHEQPAHPPATGDVPPGVAAFGQPPDTEAGVSGCDHPLVSRLVWPATVHARVRQLWRAFQAEDTAIAKRQTNWWNEHGRKLRTGHRPAWSSFRQRNLDAFHEGVRPLLPGAQHDLFDKATWLTKQEYYRALWSMEDSLRRAVHEADRKQALTRYEEAKRVYFEKLESIFAGPPPSEQ